MSRKLRIEAIANIQTYPCRQYRDEALGRGCNGSRSWPPKEPTTGIGIAALVAAVVETLEHTVDSQSCKRYRYIGLCYGAPGAGKTVSARHDADWERMQGFWNHPGHGAAGVEEIAASSTVFFTAPVVGAPSVIERQIGKVRDRLHSAAIDVRRRAENAEMHRLRDRLKNPDGYRSQETEHAEDVYLQIQQRHRAMGVAALVPDRTALLVIDEADRLKMTGLEQARSIFDRGGIGMIPIGMPGIENTWLATRRSTPASASSTSGTPPDATGRQTSG